MRHCGSSRNATRERCRRARPRRLAAPVLAALAALAATAPPPAAAQEGAEERAFERMRDSGSEQSTEPGADDPSATARGEITLRADRRRVRAGRAVTFSGRRQPARRGALVYLKYKRPGGRFRRVERTTTGGSGRYELRAKRRRTGRFVVTSPRRSGSTLRSRVLLVEVRARIGIGARKHQLRRRGVKVRGKLRPSEAGRRVVLHRLRGKGWQRVGATRTSASGSYRMRWSPPGLGGYKLRARFRGDRLNLPAQARLGRPVYVYRRDHASYYGPGFYGNRTACGKRLRRSTVGVAHKRIRCGAQVRFHYRGRTRRIPVIDRGPYVEGRRWDLTDAARRKLGFPAGTGSIWAAR